MGISITQPFALSPAGGAVPLDRAGRPRPAAGCGGRGLRAGGGARPIRPGTPTCGAMKPMRLLRAAAAAAALIALRSEEHTSELQSPCNLVCRLLLEKK